MLYRRPQLSAESGLNDSSDQGVLLCSSILLQRLSSLLLLCLVLGWHFPWWEAESGYVSDLGLGRDLPQAGVSVPKIEKADYESAWKALGCCSWRGCHPENCNRVYELQLWDLSHSIAVLRMTRVQPGRRSTRCQSFSWPRWGAAPLSCWWRWWSWPGPDG